jgi:hypothetical protein
VRTLRRILIGSALVVLLGAVVPLIAAEGLYRYALLEPPNPPALPARTAAPSLAVTAFWLEVEGRLPLKGQPLSAWRYGWDVAYDRQALLKPCAGERMASLAARAWLVDQPPQYRARWALTFWAATVWASRHWNGAEMTQVWMSGAWFGRGAHGIANASSAYFGMGPDGLALHELALLVALTPSPSRLDPMCFPERARSARDTVLRKLASAGVVSPLDYAAAVAEPLGVLPRPCLQ